MQLEFDHVPCWSYIGGNLMITSCSLFSILLSYRYFCLIERANYVAIVSGISILQNQLKIAAVW